MVLRGDGFEGHCLSRRLTVEVVIEGGSMDGTLHMATCPT